MAKGKRRKPKLEPLVRVGTGMVRGKRGVQKQRRKAKAFTRKVNDENARYDAEQAKKMTKPQESV